MRIIISPAKKMKIDDIFDANKPFFIDESEKIKTALKSLSNEELQAVWKCNDSIAKLNIDRLSNMDLNANLTPAILAYEGLQYKHMAPSVFIDEQFKYIEEHLRILSGFYGILRPFDGVVSYRLEMQAKIDVNNNKDLYSFWGDKIAKQLSSETDTILNLASKEYSKSVTPFLKDNIKFINCLFVEEKDGKLIEKGTICKMARGEMVRFLAENNISKIDDIKNFNLLGYKYSKENSNNENLIFIRNI